MSRALLALALLAAACSEKTSERPQRTSQHGPAGHPRGRIDLAARRQRALDAKPEFVAAADLDGDGLEELLATEIAPGALLVWRGNPEGPEREPRRIPVGDYPLRPLPLPPGPDGARRVAVASRAERTLTSIDPTGGAEPVRVALPEVPRALAVGDLGADGSEEVVLALDGRRLVAARDGTLVSSADLPADLPRCLLVTSDGRGVVCGLQSTRSLAAVRWNEDGFGELAHDVELPGIPRALVEADLDRDGDPELVVVAGDHALVAFGWGDSSGVGAWFGADAPLPLTWNTAAIPIDVHARDLDGHPGDELCLLTFAGLTAEVWGSFTETGAAREEVYAGQTPTALALLDLDRDGHADAAVANRDSLALSLIPGEAGGRLARPNSAAVGAFPSELVAADFTGDGAPDVLSVDAGAGAVSLCSNWGGELVDGRAFPVGPAPRAARAADLDGDGALDLALVTIDAGARLVRLFGDGRGGLARRPEAPDLVVGAAAKDLVVVDLDGNGTRELVLADDEGDRLVVVSGDPAGALSVAHEVPLAPGPAALVPLELDGDPGQELLVALAGAGAGRGLALVDLSGPRAALSELARLDPGGGAFDAVVCELDGDGTPEVAALGAGSSDGAPGTLWIARVQARPPALVGIAAAPTGLAPRSVTAGDLDGDGRDEILVAAQLSHVVNLLRLEERDGAPALVALDDLGAGIGPMASAVTDLDGDGVPEVVVANGHSSSLSVIRRRR